MMDILKKFSFYVIAPLLIGIAGSLLIYLFTSKEKHRLFVYVLPFLLIVIAAGLYVYHARPKLRHFERLTKKSFGIDEKMSLYEGSSPTKNDIGSDRDVIRKLHYQLFPKILETKNSPKNAYLSIIAPPQEGKSTLLLRFAKELVDNKEIVLWSDTTYKFALENPYDELKLIRRRRKRRIFAIIDNIARLNRYSELLQDLARRPEVKVTLIGASRIEDWEKVKFKHPTGIEYLFENPDTKPRLPYKLETTEADIEAAVKKLLDKGVLKEPKRPISKPENFNILIWALAAPEGEEEFSNWVLEEADRLSAEEKKAYCYICALHRFGLPMPASLIKRILGKDVNGGFESLTGKGIIRYIAKIDSYISRHDMVANTIFSHSCMQLPDFQPLKIYKNILQQATLNEEILMVLLFEIYLERNLKNKLKNELADKYNKIFSKSKSAKLLALGWGPIFNKLSYSDLAEKIYKKSIDIDDKLPEAHYNYASFLAEMKRYSEADHQFNRALELKEDYPEAHINYALLLVKLRKHSEAEGHFIRALELKEDDPEAHNNYANLLARMERYQDAGEHYKRALELKEDDPEAHYNYANFLDKMGRSLEAENHFNRALELKEDYPEAHNNYALLLANLKRYQESEDHYKRTLELNEDYPDGHNNYGNLLVKLERYQEAEEHYKRALELKDDDPVVYTNYANYLDKMGRYLEEEGHYKRALELNEDSPEAHNNYALLLHELKRYPDAENHYKRAIELRKDNPEAHNNYALLLADLERYPEAEEHYKRALELKEDFSDAHYNYANLLYELKRYSEVEVHYQRALVLKEDNPEANNNYALFLFKLERYIEAERHYKKALVLKEDFPEAHNNYALLLHELKRYPDAENHYKRAIELRKDNPEAHNNYALLLAILERFMESERHFKKALEINKDFPNAIAGLGFLYSNKDFRQPEKAIHWLRKAWEHRESLPDKGESVKEALKALSSEKGKKKEEKPPSNEL